MKLLSVIILFLSVNVYAEFRVEFVETSTGGTYHFEKNTETKAKKRLKKIISKSQWMEGSWSATESPLSKTETFITEEGSEEITSYYHPSNFTYTIEDITQEKADAAAAQAVKDDIISKAKAVKLTGKKWKNLNDNQKDKLIDYLMEQIQ